MFPQWFDVLFMGGLVLLWVLSIIGKVYSWFDHSHSGKNLNLRQDAKVAKVDKNVVGSKNSKKIQTIVTFEDGFQYETYQTDRENGILSYKISVSEASMKEILRKATEAHDKACGVSGKKTSPSISPVDQPSPETLEVKQNKPAPKPQMSLQDEFMSVYLQTRSKPLGAEEDAWTWVVEQIVSLKLRGLDRELVTELLCNVVTNLTNSYRRHFSDFMKLAGDMTPIVISCERLLEQGKGQEAKAIADPYLQYLLANPGLYTQNQICVQNRAEELLCLLENIDTNVPKAQDNYTMFFVMYCRILDNILHNTAEEAAQANREKEKYLQYAAKLSPCNATVWEAMARIYISGDEKQYRGYINKALKYSLREGEPYGLGAVYANMAMHYVNRDPKLSRALCTVCRRYGGNPVAAEFVLSRMNVPEAENADEVVLNAGIWVGFSGEARMIRKRINN